VVLSLLSVVAVRQSHADPAASAAALMNRLVGRWTMTGRLGGKRTIHDVAASWVLKREYVRFHEVSRERGADGGPAYEAIVLLSWHAKTSEFMCLWLDNTAGGGLSPQGIARGHQSGDTIPLVFTLSQRESLHTTFAYDRSADTWRLTTSQMRRATGSGTLLEARSRVGAARASASSLGSSQTTNKVCSRKARAAMRPQLRLRRGLRMIRLTLQRASLLAKPRGRRLRARRSPGAGRDSARRPTRPLGCEQRSAGQIIPPCHPYREAGP